MLTTKYQITEFNQFLSNTKHKIFCEKWLLNPDKPLFIHGELGVGKTVFSHLLLKKYNIIEIDTYTKRDPISITKIIDNVMNYTSIYESMYNKKSGLIIDEIENFINCSSNEKSTLKCLVKIIKNQIFKKPFILISNNISHKIIKILMKKCYIIRLTKPTKKDYIKYLKPIIKKENIKYDYKNINILNNNFRDIMLSLNDNTQIYNKYNEKNNKKIVSNIMNNKIDNYRYNKNYLYLLHENIIKKNISNKDLIEFNKNMLSSSKFNNKIFDHYHFNDICYFHTIEQNKKFFNNQNINISFSKYLNKTSQKNKRTKYIQNQLNKLNIHQYYDDYINDNTNFSKIFPFNKEYKK